MSDDRIFWERLRDMPYSEAEALLRHSRQTAIQQRNEANAQRNGDAEVELNLLITKINDELHLISQAAQRASLRKAMRAVLTAEQCEAVFVYQAQMDPRASA